MRAVLYLRCTGCDSDYLSHLTTEQESLVGVGSEFYPDKYVCPRCNAACEVHRTYCKVDSRECLQLEADELYAALHGLGLPEQLDCAKATVEQLFRSRTCVRIGGHDLPHDRRIAIDYFEFDDGTRAYLACSSFGPVIYKVVRLPNYTKRKELLDVKDHS